jgi:hypothetical protein
MSGAIPPLPNSAQLKHRDNFTFTFHLMPNVAGVVVNTYASYSSSLEFDFRLGG